MIEILGEIFDLDDPRVHRDVDGRPFGGRVILGYFEPATKEAAIRTPLETSRYVEKRIGQEEYDLFMPETSYEEFVEARQ